MILYYHANKPSWKERAKRKPRKTKGQREFRLKRAKCIHYLKRVRNWTYDRIAERLSICDGKNVFLILKRYELNQSNSDNLAQQGVTR